ncbi:4-(cytidine 5'-diphospho)-2-C-methyl-D-erythritol kinase [Laspinema sp. A4]|uniref:4-(cytidine 5'-diphospho)-2-C-methyl-D-erythritol kinase n=1 Tax=Laspinema sp. D2d TaxID=2953686 RepID=UPI0021BB6124|nr:4-(cytidine 5'-diphospho)-2-C-methyl-D-erythritol kinase [Laspinema sp. D2d]MCT7983515.1 4-(cytidine 5'-diphospho)-2-C-methyl-D-erythritol kinase [Laspinema sp. D2d]
MRSYSLFAPAKINLYLEIIGDRPDGYHELSMVLQSIDLGDRLEIRANGTEEFRIHCQHPEVPCDRTNLAYRAAELLKTNYPEAFEQYGGADIFIDKQIPVAAGLAGGSSNAAAVLVGLEMLWDLGLTQPELQDLASQLGSDIPFCITGGTALATGRGNELEPLPDLEGLYVILAKYRSLGVSTAWAYQTYRQQFGSTYVRESTDLAARQQRVHSGPIVKAIALRDEMKVVECLHNDLEKVVLPEYPQVLKLRQTFEQFDVLGTLMSGSGPTVFALTDSREKAEQIRAQVQNTLGNPDLDFWIAQFINTGIQLAPGVH